MKVERGEHSGAELWILEASQEGLEEVINRLVDLSLSIDRDKLISEGKGHRDITWGAGMDASRSQAQLNGAVEALDLILPVEGGSWLDRIEKIKAENLAESPEGSEAN